MIHENLLDRIVCDKDLLHGEPCIRGTRISVSVLVASMSDLTLADLLGEYPQLTKDDIRAALLFAADAAHNTLVA